MSGQGDAFAAGAFGYAIAAMTGLLAANGGALVTIFGLLGNACQHVPLTVCAHPWRAPLAMFVVGVVCAIGTAAWAWASQVRMIHTGDEMDGKLLRSAAGVFFACSLGAFAGGCALVAGRF